MVIMKYFEKIKNDVMATCWPTIISSLLRWHEHTTR